MNTTTNEPLYLSNEEFAVVMELLEMERAKLSIEIHHTHHRAFRDDLRQRLNLVEELVQRCRPA